ncbi:MFS transporter, partial [Chloroflexota bacterium]
AQVGQVPDGQGNIEDKERLNLPGRGFSLREAIRTRQFWMVWVIFFCFGYTRSATLVHVAPHITDLGFSLVVGANALSVISGVSIFGRIIFGRVSDSIGSRPTLVISFIMTAVILCWVVVAEQLWMLYLFAAIFGLGWGALAILRISVTIEMFGLGSLGVILGMAEFGATVGGASGPLLSGWIFDITNSYYSAFLLSAGVGVLGLIMSWLLRPIGDKRTGVDTNE